MSWRVENRVCAGGEQAGWRARARRSKKLCSECFARDQANKKCEECGDNSVHHAKPPASCLWLETRVRARAREEVCCSRLGREMCAEVL